MVRRGDIRDNGAQADAAPAAMEELRQLIVGPEQVRLADAERRLAERVTPAELAEHLPDAIALRARQDRQLGRALAPTIEGALTESVRRNPRDVATAIFPILGPAIRKAIAEAMAGLVRSINQTVDHSFSLRGLRWRWEAWRTGVPFAQVVLKHSLVYRVEQAFLIHSETGLLLAKAHVDDLALADADLVAGMLTAIQDFVADSFARQDEGARLRTFAVGQLNVYVERGPRALLAAVVRGQPPDAFSERLQDTLETIHLRMGHELREFSGDESGFAVAVPMLKDLLGAVLQSQGAQSASGGTWRWAVPLTIGLVAAAGWWWWAERRWTAAIHRLDREPGVVVVESGRGWFRSRLRGLLDPLATPPGRILAASGLDTAGIQREWEPFVSTDPPLVLARAERVLRPPPSLSLALARDTLRATGSAPADWYVRASRERSLPGAEVIDLSNLTLRLPDSLVAIGRAVDASQILFASGSARLERTAWATMDTVAELVLRIEAGLGEVSEFLVLEIIGRTDPSGTDATNVPLRQRRAEVVRDRLVALGLAPERIRVRGIDRRDPIPAADSALTTRLNRSSSFKIALGRPR